MVERLLASKYFTARLDKNSSYLGTWFSINFILLLSVKIW